MTHIPQTETIPGEMEEGMISSLPWLGEPPPPSEKVTVHVPGTWNPESQRTGVVANKVGMMNVWDARGVKTLLTVLKVDRCQVTNIRRAWTQQGEKYVNLQVGSGLANTRNMIKSRLYQYLKEGLPHKKKFAEFRVSDDAILPVGTQITARHFVPGQYVDITGTTKGKGFAGVMKKWNFGGQPASHGCSLTHRALGSTGANQDPGKVWKGKKMPGKMGNRQRTHLNYQIYKIDVARDLVFLRGSIPGNNGGFVTMQDARRKNWDVSNPPPYPTHVPSENEEHFDELLMDVSHMVDPFALG